MGNPLIDQGTLNRLRGSVVVDDSPELNVTAPYLGEGGIGLALDGEATTFINTLTGAVTSPEPYQPVTVTINLLRSQGLSDQYKQRQESNTLLGTITVRPDSSQLSPYRLLNCGVQSVREMTFNGKDAGYVVTLHGYYPINSALWDF